MGFLSRKAFWIILAVGLVLRLYHLTWQSIEHDEIFSLTVSRKPDMWHWLVEDFVQPPLHYLILRGWFHIAGFGIYQSRLLSALFGVLSVILIYSLGRDLFDRKTGLLAAALLSVSQIAIEYSQEARPYSQLLFLTLTCALLFIVSLRTGRFWWAWVGVATLALYTHYYACFAIAAFVLFWFIYRERYPVPIWKWFAGAVIILLAFLPWILSGIIPAWLAARKLSVTHRASLLDALSMAASSLNRFNNGRFTNLAYPASWWSYALGALLFVVPLGIALARGRKQRESISFLFALFAVPLVACVSIGQVLGQYDVRYVIFALGPYYLLVARGFLEIKAAALRSALITACLLYSVASLRANYFVPYKEGYKAAYSYLAQARQPDDCYIVAPPSQVQYANWAWTIYEGSSLDAPRIADPCPRTWLIAVNDPRNRISTRPVLATRQEIEETQTKITQRDWFWVHLYLYEPK
jgi:mannosyltransferase